MTYLFPRIKPIYPVYKLNTSVFRIGAQLGITTEIADIHNQFWILTKLLDGKNSLTKIILEMQKLFPLLTPEDVIKGIALLDKEGVIEEALITEKVEERYTSNVNYFSRYIDSTNNRFDVQKKINKLNILLLGLGGGGSNILALLAGLGPKKIKIVDYDLIESSNLGRQFLYRECDIGKKKVNVAAKYLKEMNSRIEVEKIDKKIITSEDVLELLEGIDIVICAIDEPPFIIHRIVNKAIVSANIPCIFGASQISRGRIYTVIPYQTGCFDCLNLNFSKNDPQFIEQFIGFRNINFSPPSIAYGPGIFFLTSTIVDELVRITTNYAPPRSLGTQYEVNYEDFSSFTHPSWARFPHECPTCGSGNYSDWEIFQYYE
ncbi:MAG: ThiF family adenylyltransferase [Culicoidibacterales bacterium]